MRERAPVAGGHATWGPHFLPTLYVAGGLCRVNTLFSPFCSILQDPLSRPRAAADSPPPRAIRGIISLLCVSGALVRSTGRLQKKVSAPRDLSGRRRNVVNCEIDAIKPYLNLLQASPVTVAVLRQKSVTVSECCSIR